MAKRKFAKISALILTLALGASVFAGCGSSSSSGNTASNGGSTKSSKPQVIKYNLGVADVKTIDPAISAEVEGADVICNTFEGLLRLDEKDNPIPGVAEKWEISADGLHYTFHLRNNALWSDGQKVTAKDFEYAWKRALAPETASDYAYQLFYLKNGEAYNGSQDPKATKKATADEVGVKATDDLTLQVDLEYPTAYFLSLMSFPTYMPVRKDMVDKDPKGWATKPETYVSNGPFMLKEWKPKESLNLTKNPKYWNTSAIQLNDIQFKMIEKDTSYTTAFKTGELDAIEKPTAADTPELMKSGLAKAYPYLGTYYITFNLSSNAEKVDAAAAKALKDVRVRKALTLAINRKDITENVTKQGEIPASAFVPQGIPEDKSGKMFAGKEYFKAEGDVAEAKKLLADAGYPDGKGFPKLTYVYTNSQSHQAIAEAVQEMWRKNLGITMELKNVERKVVRTSISSKDYVIGRDGWIADYNDPMTFLDMFTSNSGNNDAGYVNPAYDKIIDAAKNESDPAKRMGMLHQAEDTLMNDQAMLPIYYYTDVVAIKDNVKGIRISPLGFVYFDKAHVE